MKQYTDELNEILGFLPLIMSDDLEIVFNDDDNWSIKHPDWSATIINRQGTSSICKSSAWDVYTMAGKSPPLIAEEFSKMVWQSIHERFEKLKEQG